LLHLLSQHEILIIISESWRFYQPVQDYPFIQYVNSLSSESLGTCSCVLTIGGDGTVLRGASTAFRFRRPLAGINAGHIGFLAKIPEQFHEDTILQLLDERIPTKKLMTLQARWAEYHVDGILNDITLMRNLTDRMGSFHVYCDGEEISSWRSDGIVIFTPTGSTAYAYAAGGPAIDLNLKMIGLIPICSQSGRGNAIICDGNRNIIICNHDNQLNITIDGRQEASLPKGTPFHASQGSCGVDFYQMDTNWEIAKLNRTLANLS